MPELSMPVLFAVVLAAYLTGVLHGATGMAGGVVMAAILAHIIGIKAAVPVMTCALIFSHASRVVMHRHDTDWRMAGWVLLFGCPTIVLGAVIFGLISARTVAIVFALFLLASFPVKAWARRHRVRTGPRLLAGASAVWGMLAGNVIGPGFFLAPFLLGTGINRLTFVGTLATVTLAMNVLKLGVFGVMHLATPPLVALGVVVGVVTIPGNWLGRRILHGMSDARHRMVVDVLTALMIVNFAYLAATRP